MLNPWILLALLGVLGLTNTYTWYKTGNYYVSQCDTAKWESQVKTLQSQLDNQKRATAAAEKERDALALRESELETVVEDYEKQIENHRNEESGEAPGTVSACIDPRAARALRAIR